MCCVYVAGPLIFIYEAIASGTPATGTFVLSERSVIVTSGFKMGNNQTAERFQSGASVTENPAVSFTRQ